MRGFKNAAKVERRIIEAELHLDGMNTHIMRMGAGCGLWGTDYQKKLAAALGAVRGARDLLRNGLGEKQRTITTRGSKNNTYTDKEGKILWDSQYRRKNWKCPFDKPTTTNTSSDKPRDGAEGE